MMLLNERAMQAMLNGVGEVEDDNGNLIGTSFDNIPITDNDVINVSNKIPHTTQHPIDGSDFNLAIGRPTPFVK